MAPTENAQSRHPGPPLRDLRALAGLTQAETANLAGVSTNYLARVERGEEVPTREWCAPVIHALADAIGVPEFGGFQ